MADTFEFRFKGYAGEYLKEYHSQSGAVIDCPLCVGRGSYPVQDMGEEIDSVECEGCGGSGKIISLDI